MNKRKKNALRWDWIPMIVSGRKVLEVSRSGFKVSDCQATALPSKEKGVDVFIKPEHITDLRAGLEALGDGATQFVCTMLARRKDGTTYTINENRTSVGVVALCYRESADGVLHYQPARTFATALDAMDACETWETP